MKISDARLNIIARLLSKSYGRLVLPSDPLVYKYLGIKKPLTVFEKEPLKKFLVRSI